MSSQRKGTKCRCRKIEATNRHRLGRPTDQFRRIQASAVSKMFRRRGSHFRSCQALITIQQHTIFQHEQTNNSYRKTMMNFCDMNFLLTFGIMLCLMSNMIAADYPEMQLVLRGGESVRATNNPREYFGGWCEIGFPENGALYAEIPGSEGLWHVDFAPNPNSLCVNSTETVRYKLNRDGNFVIKCGFLDYITHSHQGQTIDTFMTIDDRCRLYIFRRNFWLRFPQCRQGTLEK
jgi:hypothetical protein